MKWNLRVKAGALQFVLFIGVVIAILLLAFVSLSYTHTFFGKKTETLIKTVQAADIALDYMLQHPIAVKDTIALDLGIYKEIAVKGMRTYWGVFEKYTVVSSFQKNKFSKTVLVGGKNSGEMPALFLKDKERPLVIVGNSKITGVAQLPKQGIRPGNISGKSYQQKELVYGSIKRSSATLPKIDTDMMTHLKHISENVFSNPEIAVIELPSDGSIRNSFDQPTQYIYGDELNLSGITLTGNILIYATQKIIVDASAQLQDVLLIAPEIQIKDHVTGTFQAIATRSIAVGANCLLQYPSALIVVENTTDESTATTRSTKSVTPLFIASNSTVKGVVCYFGAAHTQRFSPQIKIDSEAVLMGELYCEQNLELKGQVMGFVTTSGFMALENGSIYQNHLYMGTMNSTLLPEQYAGLLLEETNTAKAIVKWLY